VSSCVASARGLALQQIAIWFLYMVAVSSLGNMALLGNIKALTRLVAEGMLLIRIYSRVDVLFNPSSHLPSFFPTLVF